MNQNFNEKQIRFQRENLPTRLGHIASNLARIHSFSQITEPQVLKSIIAQTKWFIEWTAAEIEPEQSEELVNIQIQLALWELSWDDICSDKTAFTNMAKQSRLWSQWVLDISGLLPSTTH